MKIYELNKLFVIFTLEHLFYFIIYQKAPLPTLTLFPNIEVTLTLNIGREGILGE